MATHATQHGLLLKPLEPGTRFGKYALPNGHELRPIQAAIETAARSHGGLVCMR